MPRPRKYPQELIERGVRLALESGRPVRHVADDLGIHHETLRRYVRQAEADGGLRYISWFNHDRLHESLDDIPPVEFAELAALWFRSIAR